MNSGTFHSHKNIPPLLFANPPHSSMHGQAPGHTKDMANWGVLSSGTQIPPIWEPDRGLRQCTVVVIRQISKQPITQHHTNVYIFAHVSHMSRILNCGMEWSCEPLPITSF